MANIHLKRIASPNTWPINRKQSQWVTKPRGPHSLETGMALNVAMTDLLKLAKTNSEVKRILKHKNVMLNGKRIYDSRRNFGLLDVLSVKETKENFTIILNPLKKLEIKKIESSEANFTLSKVIGKKKTGKEVTQVNLHNGTNILLKKDDVKVGDTLVLSIPEMKVKDKLPLENDSQVYIIKGKHTGKTGVVEKKEDSVILCRIDEGTFELSNNQVVVIGKNKPYVSYFKKEKKEETKKEVKKVEDKASEKKPEKKEESKKKENSNSKKSTEKSSSKKK